MNGEKKILIIDDDNRNIFALSAVLKAKGYICLSAPGAAEGIQLLLTDSTIGVVLMDMMMPGMDGYEAIQTIRMDERISAIPIVAVTAQAMVGDKEKALNSGANEYISKPIDVQQLLNFLQTNLV